MLIMGHGPGPTSRMRRWPHPVGRADSLQSGRWTPSGCSAINSTADIGALARRPHPGRTRVLLVESRALVEAGLETLAPPAGSTWSLASMRRFAARAPRRGLRGRPPRADTLADGVRAHIDDFGPGPGDRHRGQLVGRPRPAAPTRRRAGALRPVPLPPRRLRRVGRRSAAVRMEDFYRWQRRRLGYLMDGDEPAGGAWNFDHENREPPPTDGRVARAGAITPRRPRPARCSTICRPATVGRRPRRLVADVTPRPRWSDSATSSTRCSRGSVPTRTPCSPGNWHLAHTLLSRSLNLGLLHPEEVADGVEVAYRAGRRAASTRVEGFIRQIIGWREFVWGLYWHWMPDYRDAERPRCPPPDCRRCFDEGRHGRHRHALRGRRCAGLVDDHGWTHHIQRLMVLGNLVPARRRRAPARCRLDAGDASSTAPSG